MNRKVCMISGHLNIALITLSLLCICVQVNASPIHLSETTFILPANDGEAKQIAALLEKAGAQDVRISTQAWGARLDKEPLQNLQALKKIVVTVEMPSPNLEQTLIGKGHKVIAIDHHDYEDIKRSRTTSSLEQISELLNIPLDRFNRGVAINDRSYIPGLIEAGYSEKEILEIREFDLKAQGISEIEIESNRKAYSNRIKSNGLTIVYSETTRVSNIADLHTLEAPSKVRDLLIISQDKQGISEINFYGSPEKAKELHAKAGGWKGGDQNRSMFWGNSGKVNLSEVGRVLNASTALKSRCFAAALQAP